MSNPDIEAVGEPVNPPTPAGVVRGNFRYPFFIVGVSLTQIIFFFAFSTDELAAIFGHDPRRRHEIWRYFTMVIVHASIVHLVKIIIFQLCIGLVLEISHGWKRIGTIFLASVSGGALTMSVISCQSYEIGAASGVYGLLFAHLSIIILNWNEINWKFCRVFFVSVFLFVQLSIALLDIGSVQQIQISHSGHLGGGITGFLMSIILLKCLKEHPWERKMQKICAGTLIGLFVIIVIINISFPSLYPVAQFNFDYVSVRNQSTNPNSHS